MFILLCTEEKEGDANACYNKNIHSAVFCNFFSLGLAIS